MFQIKTFNKISKTGLALLPAETYTIADEMDNEDGVLVRSGDMHEYPLHGNLKAIARAGAGTNNIPLDKCAEAGVVVFNTPGANANAVKELVLCGLAMSSRNIVGGVEWVKAQAAEGADVAKVVEKGKSQFVGPEFMGKTLGVLGLGAIGVLVANMAVALGMTVVGYDPFLSEAGKKALSPEVKVVDLDGLYAVSDYITLHVPQNNDTKGMICAAAFAKMKPGVRVLNMARGGLVNNADMKVALENKQVSCYVTDFPDSEITLVPGVVPIPHLGASSPESEENCAYMAAAQMRDYLELGNIRNSVNLPNLEVAPTGVCRVCVLSKGAVEANLAGVVNTASRGDYTYTIYDLTAAADEAAVAALKALPNVLKVRVICQ